MNLRTLINITRQAARRRLSAVVQTASRIAPIRKSWMRQGALWLSVVALLVPVMPLTAHAGTSSTTLSASTNPSTVGTPVNFTATVVGVNPTGAVTFKNGATTLGTATLSSGGNTRTAVLSYNWTSSGSVGLKSITAVYAGDTNNTTSTSGALAHTVNAKATTTALTLSANPVLVSTSLVLTAKVTGFAPTGSVTFMNGAAPLGTAALTGTGVERTATLTTSMTMASTGETLTAVYAGDSNNATSTSNVATLTVNARNSTTTLTSNLTPSTAGQNVTFTAQVAGFNPTGNVTFKDGTTTLGVVPLSAGTATYSTSNLLVGVHSIKAEFGGDINNHASSSGNLTQSVVKKNSTTAVLSSLNPANASQGVTFTATVTGTNPTGQVTFKDGANTLGAATLNAGVASFTATNLSVGSHDITAVYGADTQNNGSTSPKLVQSVTAVPTTTSVITDVNPSVVGDAVVLSATVVGANPSGSVTFRNSTSVIATVALTGSGDTRNVSTTTTFTSTATARVITAVYSGDAKNAASTSPTLTLPTVQKPAVVNLSSSLNPSAIGASVTFTASVTGYQPTGKVNFKNGDAVVWSPLLSGAGNTKSVTFPTSTLGGGVHNITAVYVGDANNATATSSVLTQSVSQPASTTVLTSNANPSVYGAPVTFTSTVTGSAPTGEVTFMDGATTVGVVTLTGSGNARTATLSTSALGAGSRNLTALYAGDSNNATSTSASLAQVVTQAPSATVVVSSSSAAEYGASVTFTATVTGVNPGGTVTFKDGSVTLGTSTLTGSGGTRSAILTTSALSVGTHGITAEYAGDTNHATSTSTTINQVINTAAVATTTSLVTSANPAASAAAVTFTASVSGNAPSGNVEFKDGATTLGTVALSSGTASYSTSNLSAGLHSITAVYAGDANNLASTSSVLSQNITAAVGPLSYQYGYDAMGRRHTVVDPNGLATYTYYDSLGRAIQTQQPAGIGASTPTVTNLGYDLADNLTTVSDPRSLTTSYSPNGLGNVTAQSSPDTGATGFTYDAAGRLLSKTDSRGKTTTLGYDALDRVTSVSYSGGAGISLEYDGGANPTLAKKGELTKVTDESGSTDYDYDSAGRLISKTQTINGKPFVVGYTWGDTGPAIDKLIAVSYPSGNKVNYSYDSYGQISAITVSPVGNNGSGFASDIGLLSGLNYNVDGAPTAWNWASGAAKTIGYNSYGAVTSYSMGKADGAGAAAGVQRSVSRDSAGRIVGYTTTSNGVAVPAMNQAFAYDNLGRLVASSIGSTSTQYNYDASGNRTSKVINGVTYTSTVSPTSNRNVSVQDVGGTYSVVYDNAGNVTSDAVNTYTYSDRGRMASATTAGGTVNYLYNFAELRVAKSGPTALVPTGKVHYIYNEGGQLLGEYDANGVPLYETVYLEAMPVGVLKQTGSAGSSNIAVSVYNVDTDHLSAPRIITRQSDNAIVWRWDSAESYGGSAPDQNPNGLGAFSYNQRFPGQTFDQETGLFQNWHRDYNPRIGRYMQSDPIGLAGGINTYSYVEGNPLMLSDSEGLQAGGMGFPNIEGDVKRYQDALVEVYANALLLVPIGGAPTVAKMACEVPAHKYGIAFLTAINLWTKVPKNIPKIPPALNMSTAKKTVKEITEASKTVQPKSVPTQPYP